MHGPAITLQMANTLNPPLPQTDRRGLFRMAAAGSLLALGHADPIIGPALAAGLRAARPVVGFHNDTPWLDRSGTDLPYLPPRETRQAVPDAEALARLGFFL